jgi:hypothetical protein
MRVFEQIRAPASSSKSSGGAAAKPKLAVDPSAILPADRERERRRPAATGSMATSKLTGEALAIYHTVLKPLRDTVKFGVFAHPVDPIADDCPTYFDVVKKVRCCPTTIWRALWAVCWFENGVLCGSSAREGYRITPFSLTVAADGHGNHL